MPEGYRLNPELPEAHFGLGIIYLLMDDLAESTNAFKMAIRLKPDYYQAHSGLGEVWGRRGYYQEAVDSFNKALGIKPDYAWAHFSLGCVQAKYGMKAAALQEHEILKSLNLTLADELFLAIVWTPSPRQKFGFGLLK